MISMLYGNHCQRENRASKHIANKVQLRSSTCGAKTGSPTGINADRRGNIQKLQHVKTPIPALIFRHVGWRLAQPFGHHRLRQAGRFPPRFKQITQLFVKRGVNSLWQFWKPRRLGFQSKSLWRILPKWEKMDLCVSAVEGRHRRARRGHCRTAGHSNAALLPLFLDTSRSHGRPRN